MKTIHQLLFGSLIIKHPIANFILLLIRFFAGLSIMIAGLNKLPLPSWMVEQVAEIGFPFPLFFAWLACFVEFACGVMLILGVNTRIASFLLAFVMGVAAFASQGVTPFIDIHVAQTYFWLYALLAIVGAGKFSIDFLAYDVQHSKLKQYYWLGLPIFLLLLSYGLFREFTMNNKNIEDTELVINKITLPGTFNNWDLTANELTLEKENLYKTQIDFAESAPIEFKFAVNESWAYSAGEKDQNSAGFPVSGIAELDGQNIMAYIPYPGKYEIQVNLKDYSYSITQVKNELQED